MQKGTPDSDEGTPRRFDVELFIVHPALEPEAITAALGLQAHRAHRVGDPMKTPRGALLSGAYPDTRWRHSIRYDTREQWFAVQVANLVDRLAAHKTFLKEIRSTGGRASLIVQFLGDGYFGDEIPRDTLAKLADLDLDLAIECFSVPQS